MKIQRSGSPSRKNRETHERAKSDVTAVVPNASPACLNLHEYWKEYTKEREKEREGEERERERESYNAPGTGCLDFQKIFTI